MRNITLNIDGIIFDSDGTLVDSETLSAEVIVDILHSLGVTVTKQQILERFRGTRFSIFAASLLADFPVTDVGLFTLEFRNRTADVFTDRLKPMPGAVEVIRNLEIEKCVASNGPREKIELCLDVTGLLPYFQDRIASAYEIGSWKPDPSLILHAASMMNLPAHRCLLIEDSLAGVEAGLAAGVKVIGYRLSDEIRGAVSHPIQVIAELYEVREMAGLPPA
ncbi:HAD-IA family hydrolase [Paraburkholderia largidicola]|uniref:6-phosphogluconate phosphatase n=1 Tax=Paraburkholderia largidicola TaxID=3014751 RepID=A0A7I8C3H4_9BURK|nr:HAD-IA family hydrolase [Paraburkholderia sp. PGU16]BCF95079.1 6-phosphogluconate phosphatase [Paraburkholderia sp. PGU16]